MADRCWFVCLALWLTGPLLTVRSETPEERKGEAESVALRGRIVELHEELRKEYRIDVATGVKPVWGFKTPHDGRIFTLLETRRSLALFMDERLKSRELIIKGRRFPGTQIVEATFLQSILDGVVHDLYYYCDICAITSITPEICDCCREPVRLVEEPASEKRAPTARRGE